jgi:hypothetical protein
MATLSNFYNSVRYDLNDYGTGLEYDDVELLEYTNRIITALDSSLGSLNHDALWGTESDIDTVASQDYIDITDMNNGYWQDVTELWLGQVRIYQEPLPLLHYHNKFKTNDEFPTWWALEDNHIVFESGCDDAHTNVTIHYIKKHRPRLNSWSDTFTVANATEIFTVSPGTTFVTGDGPFQVSNSGGALPTGLSASTNYWLIRITDTTFYLATSKSNAIAGTNLTVSDDGSGTNTITLTEMTPYDGKYDNWLREGVVMHAKAKKEDSIIQPDVIMNDIFTRRAMQETIKRGYVPKRYYMDF